MRIVNVLLASVAAIGLAFPACAKEDPAVDPDAAAQRAEEIIVVGKSYGQEVGKTVTPLQDVPNTITVIDRLQIEAQNLLSLEDALTAANGITVTGVGSEDPSFMSRGFAINNYLVDGVSTLAFNFPSVVPDLFFYERLEVLRGPAGLFSGSGNPAGSINLVRKRPLDGFRVQASAGYGSWNNFRGELDVSAPLGSGVGVRGGVKVQDQDQFFDTAHRFASPRSARCRSNSVPTRLSLSAGIMIATSRRSSRACPAMPAVRTAARAGCSMSIVRPISARTGIASARTPGPPMPI